MNRHIICIAKKELGLFFSSPIAYLYLGVFAAAVLFTFFWGEAFFSRNIADIRPMFEWMPLLLIFLSAAITMRMWSEERRSGTLEHILTLPCSPWNFVLGKFAACKTLLIISLAVTLPLPISVALMANLDWGPVISAYIATVFLGTTYMAIGLFVSSQCNNQIVSLILTVLLCGLFYLLGTNVVTDLVSTREAGFLRSLSTLSRFESITRGVLDFRDLYYYVALALIFLIANRYTLEQQRWANNPRNTRHTTWLGFTSLAILNLLLANIWLAPLTGLRVDLTEGKLYSLTDTSRTYLKQLQEPLQIRSYFSKKTHPLLAPLVPQLKDLVKEYEVEGRGNVNVEFIDPTTNAEIEEEAGSRFGIRPTPFRVADRYQSAVVNSYFNLVIEYGGEYRVLGFEDLIETKSAGIADIEVLLKNPEYDITNAIKQVIFSYQAGGNLFDNIADDVKFAAYFSPPSQLPDSLVELAQNIQLVLQQTADTSYGRFSYTVVDPEANDGALARELEENYGFQPMASSLFNTNTFYFYMLMSNDDIAVQIPIPQEFDEQSFRRALDAGLKRFAKGFTKTLGLVAPESNPYAAQFGAAPGPSFNALEQVLNENMTSKRVDLSKGSVPDDIDLLALLAPEELQEAEVFAIDQFLMKGGTVLLTTSPVNASLTQQAITGATHDSGVGEWLKHHGIEIAPSFVLDKDNAAFPVPVTRQVGMFQVQEMRLIDYPYFIEIRRGGISSENAATSAIEQITIPWASPITLDNEKLSNASVETLLQSSKQSWLSDALDVNPSDGNIEQAKDFDGPHTLAVSLTGKFSSYYAGKPSPLLAQDNAVEKSSSAAVPENSESASTEPSEIISSVIQQSGESARIIVLASNSFAEDRISGMLSSISGNNYTAPFELITNAIEWSLEDEGLLSIRSVGHFNRTLPPMEDAEKQRWELINYVVVLIIILCIYISRRLIEGAKIKRYQATVLAEV